MLSIASLWEIAIKVNLKKLTLPDDYERFIPQQISSNNIEVLAISLEHVSLIAKMPLHHRDPFDRILIAQAIAEKTRIISADTSFDLYEVNRHW